MKFLKPLETQLEVAYNQAFHQVELKAMKDLLANYQKWIDELLEEDEVEEVELDPGGDEE